MIRIHKEGIKIVQVTGSILLILVIISFLTNHWLLYILIGIIAFIFLFLLQFFRNPERSIPALDDSLVYAPADGKVVVIEQVKENEVLKAEMIQISIFMSPIDVHVNRNPVSGLIIYYKYHPGKYLVAWNPKSSMENERTTVVYDTGKSKVLVRQIAGAVARRILNYLSLDQKAIQGDDMGFIKFGSRVDVLLPPDTDISVNLNDPVKGNKTVLARLN